MTRNDDIINLVAGARRNPRKEPKPGDVLSKYGFTRKVTEIGQHGSRRRFVAYDMISEIYGQSTGVQISMTNWRAWARTATVLEVAK